MLCAPLRVEFFHFSFILVPIGQYCHVSGFPWLIITVMHCMIGFIGISITITLNYNQLQQLIIGDRLRLAPLHPGLRASSLPLWPTFTSSASVVRWLTLDS
jgi:hypothetical protein